MFPRLILKLISGQTCRCFPGLTTATDTCLGKDDRACVDKLMNMMGDFDTVEHKVCHCPGKIASFQAEMFLLDSFGFVVVPC